MLAVWSFQGVGAARLEALRETVPAREWFSTDVRDLAAHLDLRDADRVAFEACPSLEQRAEKVHVMMTCSRQRVCFRGEPEYPARLASIANAPPLLFFYGPGATASVREVVAIVGTRKTQGEWLAVAKRLAAGCSEQGLAVVSGMAEGVDSAAHLGTLSARGVTWAFVAQGLDELDAGQKVIGRKLLRGGGTIFTIYPPGHRPTQGQFVQRNRLISGSAGATVMVRGKKDSGARHTTQAAFEQGRAVLAVPTAPFDTLGGLERELFEQGARVCYGPTDVLAALGLTTTRTHFVAVERGVVSEQTQQIFAQLPVGLFDMEAAVQAVPSEETGTIAAALMELELAGWVVQKTGRRYEKRE